MSEPGRRRQLLALADTFEIRFMGYELSSISDREIINVLLNDVRKEDLLSALEAPVSVE